MQIPAMTCLNAATATGWASQTVRMRNANAKHMAWIQSASTGGALTATVEVWASDDIRIHSDPDNAAKVALGTLSLSGTSTAANSAGDTKAQAQTAPYAWTRHKITAISGTGAAVYSTVAEDVK